MLTGVVFSGLDFTLNITIYCTIIIIGSDYNWPFYSPKIS